MKRLCVLATLVICCTLSPTKQTGAQVTDIIQIIKEGVKKVIVAVDLQIQRSQTKTIWLQNAQKVLENSMSQLKLTDIADWVEKQKDLYANYYQELWEVKSVIAYYQRVKEIIREQVELVNAYKQAFAVFQQDKNFTEDEISYMYKVYSGILDESVKSLDQILNVINAFTTQMSDAQRLAIIDDAAKRIDQNYSDIKEFNNENIKISLQRAKEYNDVDVEKRYGIAKKGIDVIQEFKNGEFNLHEAFFNSLKTVNPTVKNAAEVTEIIALQLSIVTQFKDAIKTYKQSDQFNNDELIYINNVYANLTTYCLKDIDALMVVITNDSLQMSDDERMKQINIIYADMQDKNSFTQYFTNSANMFANQRFREQNDISVSHSLYGLPH